jgi:TrmH family RNA methyltransferase
MGRDDRPLDGALVSGRSEGPRLVLANPPVSDSEGAAGRPLVRSLSSRDNPVLRLVRRLVEHPNAYRQTGQVWLEGEHLCQAVLARGWRPARALVSQAGWAEPQLSAMAVAAPRVDVLPDALFAQLGGMPSPASVGFLVDLPAAPAALTTQAAVLLDRVQDAGNVGSILRTAAAMGVSQVLATVGTAALWSPKVLRAGMGAHFALRLVEGLDMGDLDGLATPLVAGSSHASQDLDDIDLPDPCVWVLGHEGQGVRDDLLRRCALTVRIPQPGGEESLNVAAAAAICLYESARRRRTALRD